VEELLGLTFEKIELSKADEKKKLKKITPKKVKKLTRETVARKTKPKGKKRSVTIAAKGRKAREEIEDVFFWAY
jgi:hypothetical protein